MVLNVCHDVSVWVHTSIYINTCEKFCFCLCVYISSYIHTFIHIYIHTCIRTCLDTYVHDIKVIWFMHTYINGYTYIWLQFRFSKHLSSSLNSPQTHTYTYTIHMHTHIHTFTFTYYTYLQTQFLRMMYRLCQTTPSPSRIQSPWIYARIHVCSYVLYVI